MFFFAASKTPAVGQDFVSDGSVVKLHVAGIANHFQLLRLMTNHLHTELENHMLKMGSCAGVLAGTRVPVAFYLLLLRP